MPAQESSWSYSTGLALCVFLGCLLGGIFGLVATVIWAVRGGGDLAGGIPLSRALLLYAIAGPLAGVIAGLLNPLARTPVGAAFLGMVSFLPLSLGAMVLVSGGLVASDADLTAFLATTVFVGGGIGFLWWREFVHRGVFPTNHPGGRRRSE